MKAFFANIWTKRFVSLIAALYTVGVCYLAYYSIFFTISVQDKVSLCLVVSAISVIGLVLMLYTRQQILTRISSFIILIAMLPVVLLYFSEKELLIPIVITGVIILLLSGAGEGTKTLIGTVILLLYIFAALGFFLFNSFFVTHAKTDVIETDLSPSGKYRYSIVNTEDSSGGSTAVYIEPNYAEVHLPFVTFTLKNMRRIVYLERPTAESIELEWTTQARQEITEKINGISDTIEIALTDKEHEEFGRTADSRLQIANVNVYTLFEAGKTASDVDPFKLDTLDDQQLAVFDIGRDSAGSYYVLDPTAELCEYVDKSLGDTVYLSELDAKGRDIFNNSHLDEYGYTLYDLQKSSYVNLSELTDEQLAYLGVSESGDVLTLNGKTIFRYYVAEIEDYFDVDSRKLSFDLLNS